MRHVQADFLHPLALAASEFLAGVEDSRLKISATKSVIAASDAQTLLGIADGRR